MSLYPWPKERVNAGRVYTWPMLAADTKLWLALLWNAMGRSGKGYRRYSLRHTGKQSKDDSWDRRADKTEGPLAGVPKFFRSYHARYAAPQIASRTPRQLRRARAAARAA